MKYSLVKGKKEVGVFKSYDQARNHARKILRATLKGDKREVACENKDVLWDSVSRNPSSIRAFGFRIVAA